MNDECKKTEVDEMYTPRFLHDAKVISTITINLQNGLDMQSLI